MDAIKCQESNCTGEDIMGRCNTCNKFNYLCTNHLCIHMKNKHKIVQLEQEEIMAWKQNVIDQEKASKKNEYLKKINEVKSKIIFNSLRIIQAVKASTKNALEMIDKHINLIENLRKEEIQIPKINIKSINMILEKFDYLFYPKCLNKLRLTDDDSNLAKRKNVVCERKMVNEKFIDITKIDVIYMSTKNATLVNIWKARVNKTGKVIALKECTSPNLEDLNIYFEEASILRLLSGISKNFLEFYGEQIEQINEGSNLEYAYTIYMEYVESNLKSDKIQRDLSNQPYNDHEMISIYKQLITAYNLLIGKNILHCDIKPSNIMITNDFVIKIIDFDTAKIGIDERTQEIRVTGTVQFMSPEMRKGFDNYGLAKFKEDKSDVFSLGLTILSLVTKGQLVDLNLNKNRQQLIDIIESIRYEWLKPILHRMLEFDYSKRFGLKDLIKAFPEDATITQQV